MDSVLIEGTHLAKLLRLGLVLEPRGVDHDAEVVSFGV